MKLTKELLYIKEETIEGKDNGSQFYLHYYKFHLEYGKFGEELQIGPSGMDLRTAIKLRDELLEKEKIEK
jgi:hypothetical protein